MMCHSSGRPPTSTIGLGRYSVSSRNLMPWPPARMITLASAMTELPHVAQELQNCAHPHVGGPGPASPEGDRYLAHGKPEAGCPDHDLGVDEPVPGRRVEPLQRLAPQDLRLAVHIRADGAEQQAEKRVVDGRNHYAPPSVLPDGAAGFHQVARLAERRLKDARHVAAVYLLVAVQDAHHRTARHGKPGEQPAAVALIGGHAHERDLGEL